MVAAQPGCAPGWGAQTGWSGTLPTLPTADRFRRWLGGMPASHKISKAPDCQGEAEDDQSPHKSRHSDHRSLIAEAAKSSVGLKEPCLHQVSWGYHDERREIVHVSESHGRCDASESQHRNGGAAQTHPHPLRLRYSRCPMCQQTRARSITLTSPGAPASAQRPVSRSRCSGYRAPCTVIFAAARSMSRRSAGVSSTAKAPMFSSRRGSFRVPGMGTIHGF